MGLLPRLIGAMASEIALQRGYLEGERVETVYFGGGTPSLLGQPEMDALLTGIRNYHTLSAEAEVTLEVNPDDVTLAKLKEWRSLGINRLSIGIQSFDNEVLKYLNRIHTSGTAIQSVELAREVGFHNISIDLIYAIPRRSSDAWRKDLDLALRLDPPHISAYTLTIEEKTVFGNWTARGKMKPVDELAAAEQLEILMETLALKGYRHYEISNFARPGFESRHNSSYWKGVKYLGIGPSAHSYNQVTRQANVANNHSYIRALEEGKVPAEIEMLTRADHINDYILTSLRTDAGSDLSYLKHHLDYDVIEEQAVYLEELRKHKLISIENGFIRLTSQGRLLADKIASDLFYSGTT